MLNKSIKREEYILVNFNDKINFIWKIAELLRGPYKPEKYGEVILPMSVLRRFDCLLAENKDKVVELGKTEDIEALLNYEAGYGFSNKSQYDFEKLLDDPDNIKANFESYIQGFSSNIREIIENFEFASEIKKLNDNNLLFLVIKEFANIDLHPEAVSNQEMGYIFEEGEYCKIFDNKEFGFLKVTIERPLQLNFKINEEGIENLYSERAFNSLYDEEKMEKLELEKEKKTIKKNQIKQMEKLEKGKKLQDEILSILRENISEKLYKNREEFQEKLDNLFKDIKLTNPQKKAILLGLSERDEEADYCMKGKKKEADTSLRDTESIPLSLDVDEYNIDTSKHIKKEKANILDYVEKEVAPHVKEYWIDHSKTRIGYEIPFTRYFYKYEELRPFKDIMAEIEELEKEIQ